MDRHFQCRENCGACCIAPSISSAIPGMPNGKPAGVNCIHLNAACQCALFGQKTRPDVCRGLKPCYEMCGNDRQSALDYLSQLEKLTQP